MLYTEKQREPIELINEKRNGLKSYNDMSSNTKTAIRKTLLREQGHLCAYCMQRIDLPNMTIEHYIPQNPSDREADDMLSIDYNNMLAVCSGNIDGANRKSDLTCDKHRGNIPLTVDPRDEYSIEKICYKDDGTMYSLDPNINRDLDETLNLNCTTTLFKQNRKSVLDVVKQGILKRSAENRIAKRQLENMLAKLQTKNDEKYVPFCGIAIWYLRKKLSRY